MLAAAGGGHTKQGRVYQSGAAAGQGWLAGWLACSTMHIQFSGERLTALRERGGGGRGGDDIDRAADDDDDDDVPTLHDRVSLEIFEIR